MKKRESDRDEAPHVIVLDEEEALTLVFGGDGNPNEEEPDPDP